MNAPEANALAPMRDPVGASKGIRFGARAGKLQDSLYYQ